MADYQSASRFCERVFAGRISTSHNNKCTSKVELSWEEQDWRAFSDVEREKRLADFLAADRRRGFDMEHAPLFRLTLLRYGEADNRLIWTYHHILLDGRSRRLLQREVFAYYEAFLRDEDHNLATAAAIPRLYRLATTTRFSRG